MIWPVVTGQQEVNGGRKYGLETFRENDKEYYSKEWHWNLNNWESGNK